MYIVIKMELKEILRAEFKKCLVPEKFWDDWVNVYYKSRLTEGLDAVKELKNE